MTSKERDILIQQLLDGAISPADFETLQEHLLGDPDARKRLYDYANLHHGLNHWNSGRNSRELGGTLRAAQQRRSFRQTVLAAAAVLTLLAVALHLLPSPPPEPTVTLRTADGSVFRIDHAGVSSDEPPPAGTLAVGSSLLLDQGTAELTLSSGVTAIVRAPARVVIQEPNRVYLPQGRSWFRVEEEGHGFQVVTEELEVIDLGTEFGVIASENQSDEVHCFTGNVRARALKARGEEALLTKNLARSGDFLGRLEEVPLRPDEFLNSLPAGPTHLHWSFDGAGDERLAITGEFPGVEKLTTTFAPSRQSLPQASVSGRFGGALRFDGKENFLLTDWPGISGDKPRSAALWFKIPQGYNEKSLLLGWGTQLEYDEQYNFKFTVALSNPDGKRCVPSVSFGGSRYYCRNIRVDDGEWHHLACVYEGGNLSKDIPPVKIYLDGELQSLRFADSTRYASDQGQVPAETRERTPLAIGTGLSSAPDALVDAAYRFRGELDELYIFEEPLSAEVVRLLFTENRLR